jgi:hypothetical protein
MKINKEKLKNVPIEFRPRVKILIYVREELMAPDYRKRIKEFIKSLEAEFGPKRDLRERDIVHIFYEAGYYEPS